MRTEKALKVLDRGAMQAQPPSFVEVLIEAHSRRPKRVINQSISYGVLSSLPQSIDRLNGRSSGVRRLVPAAPNDLHACVPLPAAPTLAPCRVSWPRVGCLQGTLGS